MGPQSSSVMIVLTAYAVLKQGLLDIKAVIQRGLVYMIVIGLITGCYSALLALLLTFMSSFTTQAYLIAVIITICLGILGFDPLKKFFIRLTDSTFYRNHVTHEAAVNAFSQAINEIHSPGQMVYGISATVRDVFRAESVSFIALQQTIPSDLSVRPMTPEECHQLTNECPVETVPKIDVIIPLIFESHITALIGLGNKKSGEPYYADDLAMLTAFAYQAALALDKSQRYQQAKDQVAHLQDQRQQDEAALAATTERIQQGMSSVSQTMSLIANLRNQLHANPQQPLGVIVEDLAKFESTAQLAKRPTGGDEQMQTTPSFDLSILLKRLTDHFVSLAERQGGILRAEIAPDLVVAGSSQTIENTLVDTIVTSLRYADDQHEILVTLRRVGDCVELCVLTNGHGMPIAELPPYFDQLRRTAGFGSATGTGLTLSLTPQEVAVRDESLEVSSTTNRATEVCFTFKLAA